MCPLISDHHAPGCPSGEGSSPESPDGSGACIAGIDYGSRNSGNTVLSWKSAGGRVGFFRPPRARDADAEILRVLADLKPVLVGIDAPLSLPGRYRDIPGCIDYFYRHCDRALGAMSPMFLGGLTARAIRLRDELGHRDIPLLEVYPVQLAKHLELPECGYRGTSAAVPACLQRIAAVTHLEADPAAATTWHHLDALMALAIAHRVHGGGGRRIGLAEEGLIYGW
jgi:uncharacterized protein